MTTSIIIPVYNRFDLTVRCIKALEATAPDAEVILVDNGSLDETQGLRVAVRNATNRGFARACNQGARRAAGDVLVFLNNDTEPEPGWLEPLEAALDDESVGAVGPLLIYPDGSVQSAGVTVDFGAEWGAEAANITELGQGRDVDAVTGACVAMRYDTFDLLGGFDETYINGYEDVDLCLRLTAAGKRVVFEPASRVMHLESQTEGRFAHVRHNVDLLRRRWSE